MKDLTLKFADRADFSAFMDSIGYYDDESMQDDILIDVIGNVYKETGELTEDVDWPPESPDNQYHLNK
ncbi:hypothetical protein JA515_13600 [Escherichia coli]|nr:hypothetical protein [Escherichia coli]MDE3862919.1 hypothetical protein [Escherichia coli]MDE3871078.1 hypothetical protein [Escherichia coli]MDE3879111.1 hypothetical protein [Escherichia coli]MDE3889043.1 hypothetical protein [Escherichia coli]